MTTVFFSDCLFSSALYVLLSIIFWNGTQEAYWEKPLLMRTTSCDCVVQEMVETTRRSVGNTAYKTFQCKKKDNPILRLILLHIHIFYTPYKIIYKNIKTNYLAFLIFSKSSWQFF